MSVQIVALTFLTDNEKHFQNSMYQIVQIKAETILKNQTIKHTFLKSENGKSSLTPDLIHYSLTGS